MTRAGKAEELGRGALDWMLRQARETDAGLAWPVVPSAETHLDAFYLGTEGVVRALLEGHRHFGDDRYADAALRGARHIAVEVGEESYGGLYIGAMGKALVLRAVGERLDDSASRAAVAPALAKVGELAENGRWAGMVEILYGNAGVILGALVCGDLALAVTAAESMAAEAERTEHGVNWRIRADSPRHVRHMAHGAVGNAFALASAGAAADRPDLTELALAAVAEVLSHDEADGPEGLLIARNSDAGKSLDERCAYGWCAGAAGDAQLFRHLARITGDPAWSVLVDRCWHTITHSGLPARKWPGFWDNVARCCGTAGVLALGCDLVAEGRHGAAEFTDVLADDLIERAIVDAEGVRWSNYDHEKPGDLEPGLGWGHGASGIVPELLRYARIGTGRGTDYAVAWPDQPPADRTPR
ncbi:lanthionine synthetase LanC family protein [Phytomonospora sp. NPDC050363]|uniref:lanthionine synthetase LanC family protein n=1 Tax=Phytomonospora sp. NPDC050363 TaxID=3155642 RepID=UPI0033EBFEAE